MKHVTLCSLAAGLAVSAAPALAGGLLYDQNLTSNVIFGSGNANGGFTVARNTYAIGNTTNTVELALRGKLRFNDNNQPENTFNSNGDGTYTFRAGNPPTGFGFAPNSPTTPVWSFDWSVNVDADGSGQPNLATAMVYQISLDADPGAGTDFMTFDPITAGAGGVDYWDHAIGDNTTANGAGAVAPFGDGAAYFDLLANNSVAQNSWNYEFFNGSGPLTAFDPNEAGIYTIQLEAFRIIGLDSEGAPILESLAMTEIDILVAIPLPSGVGLASVGLLAVGARRRRGL